jgi:hypothetical protein
MLELKATADELLAEIAAKVNHLCFLYIGNS